MKKIVVVLLLIAIVTAGCAEKSSNSNENTTVSNETTPADIVETSVETNTTSVNTVATPVETNTTLETSDNIENVPELQIVSVTAEDNGINIKVKNVGNASAENVYCGVLLYGGSNNIAMSEYMTLDILKEAVLQTVKGGVTGTTYDYDTGYQYKDTPNLTISSRMIGINFLGNIEPGQTSSSSIDIVDYGTSRSEYLKVAWMADDEENLVMY